MSKKLNSRIPEKPTNPYKEGRIGLVYARVSSKKQETEGSGLQSQEGRCVSDLKRLEVEYGRSFLDSYTGGGDFMKRPAMKELLEYIDSLPHKKFIVIFDDLKRFARDVEFHFKLRTAFKLRDVVLRCLNYNFDESPEGEFAELIMAGQAQLERKQNSRQVVQKMKARLEAGYWCFSSKKGYDKKDDPIHGKIYVSNAEGIILKEGMELFLNRNIIRRVDLCRFLVKKGFYKGQRPEKYIDRITHILQDPFYAGDIEYLPWDVARRKGYHEGIITVGKLGLLQKLLNKENGTKRAIRQDISEEFPLRDLILCEGCKKHITGAFSKGRNKKYPYYWCQNVECPMNKITLRKADVEDRFNTLLKKHTLKKEVEKVVKIVFDRSWEMEVKNIKNQEMVVAQKKSQLEEKIKQLTELVVSSKSNNLKRIYEDQLEKVAQDIEDLGSGDLSELDLSVPYRTALGKATGLLKNPYKIWETLDVFEKHKTFFFIFDEKLLYDKKEGYRTNNIPSAVRLFEEFATMNTYDVPPQGLG